MTAVEAAIEAKRRPPEELLARGAVLSEGGQAFIVLHSTTADEQTSRIVPRLHPGAAVTTFKSAAT